MHPFRHVSQSHHFTIMESHSSSPPPPLKVYFISFVAPSHIVSLFELSRLFASRGIHVTFFSTPSTTTFLQKSILKANAAGHHIHIQNLKFPSHDVGLPDGVENLIGVDDVMTAAKVHRGMGLLRHQMEPFMDQNPPDCIVADIFHPWASEYASRVGIPRLVFDGSGLFPACLTEAIHQPDSPHHHISSRSDPFILPGLPHPITMTFSRLPEYIQTPSGLTQMVETFRIAESKSYGRIINSFAELEEDYIAHYKKTTGKTVWHVGPTTLLNSEPEDKAERNFEPAVGHEEILSWLDSKRPGSVLYICFGSAAYFSDEQLLELSSAIESSGHDFIWVVKNKDRIENESEEEREKWMPKDFELKIRREGRGLVIRGWAPQAVILDHVAVGGFMTHCGWNSMMEGIGSGVPMVTWPLHSEQFFNEKLITQVHGIGVEVGAEDCAGFKDHDAKNLVERRRIESAVRSLMDGGDEAVEMRRRVRELSEKAKAAIGDGGSSHKNLTALIQELQVMRSDRAKVENGISK